MAPIDPSPPDGTRRILPLAAVVENIFVGIPTSRHAARSGENGIPTSILSVGDLEDGHLPPIGSIPRIELRPGNFDRFRIHPGDVLVSCRGTVLKTALTPGDVGDVLASSNIITIRPTPAIVRPQLVLALLRAPAWQETLRSRTRSSTGLMQLSIKDIEDLAVPVLGDELQALLTDLLDAEERAYEAALRVARKRRALVESLVTRALLAPTESEIDGATP
jgi:hypothetical protein